MNRYEQCMKGHSLKAGDPNVYIWQNAEGRIVYHCRQCRTDRYHLARQKKASQQSNAAEINE